MVCLDYLRFICVMFGYVQLKAILRNNYYLAAESELNNVF